MSPPSDGITSATYHRGHEWSRAIRAGVVVAVAIAYCCVRWRPSRVEISGPSMEPTLQPGDWALTTPARRPRVGDVVVVEHPGRPGFQMVKRIVAGPGDRAPGGRALGPSAWWVQGENPVASTDSRQFGPVARERILARVRLVYWPPERRRLVRRHLETS
jgi:nickel-type superoxide dismutase maturation protease